MNEMSELRKCLKSYLKCVICALWRRGDVENVAHAGETTHAIL